MSYKRAEEVLPAELIKELHKYVSGECLYIPVKYERISWGIKTGYRQELNKRDYAIYESHQKGVRISELSEKYFLSEKSIYRILSKINSMM